MKRQNKPIAVDPRVQYDLEVESLLADVMATSEVREPKEK